MCRYSSSQQSRLLQMYHSTSWHCDRIDLRRQSPSTSINSPHTSLNLAIQTAHHGRPQQLYTIRYTPAMRAIANPIAALAMDPALVRYASMDLSRN